MIRKFYILALIGACALAFSGSASAQLDRVSATQKGSLLIFSKIEVKWDAQGNLTQDTIVDVANDYPSDVAVQAYFINGDIELPEICSDSNCTNIVQEYEPGWNTADCRFELTGNQPHFWSAAKGSDKCQSFTVLDDMGRPDPETAGQTRILRGYVIMWAVKHFTGGLNTWEKMHWNHLKGDAVIVNYENGSAWEYNAWAFQAIAGVHGDSVGTVATFGELIMDGVNYQLPYANLILDFYATGSTALSDGNQTVMVDTDLTLHAVSADLRQDNLGPVLTKVEAEIWNEFETKFSGTRRCICCWDEAMLSDWVRSVAIPNHFTRAALRTDKGKARLDGVASTECNYADLCGETATTKRCGGPCDEPDQGEDAAILGVAAKFLSFTPSGDHALAGMNLVGMGTERTTIRFDRMGGPEELNDAGRVDAARGSKLGGGVDRNAQTRGSIEIPAE